MSAVAQALARLQHWFRSQCDGDWEHSYGVKIETLDNPGWIVTVDLTDTAWEQLKEPRKTIERSETDWIQSEIVEGKFIGCGGPGNLEEVLDLFLDRVIPSNRVRGLEAHPERPHGKEQQGHVGPIKHIPIKERE